MSTDESAEIDAGYKLCRKTSDGAREMEPEQRARQHADGVYHRPSTAEDEARLVLERRGATPSEYAEALTTLGRSAYYDNRLSDAIAHLERALALAPTPSAVADISLTLAPVLSKVGRSADALELLGLDEHALSDEQRGKLQNQRGVIHVETGHLPEALDAFTAARDIHRRAGDDESEARSLVNMAAAASELGRLVDAESWYAEAWRISRDTGQDFASAIIEGNLGYVASRRGDFGAALAWYQRGRTSFSQLGNVDLLVAVLETDHAATLLDLGLDADAYEAAEYARSSSVDGENRMLEIQALLLEGEAQLRLGQSAQAERSLTAAHDLATQLDVRPLQLKSEYLMQGLRSVDHASGSRADRAIALAEGLRAAGWDREALRTLVLAAQAAIDAGDWRAAATVLEARPRIRGGVDALDVAHADALDALLSDDDDALAAAMLAGERELRRERQLVNNAELEARLGHRIRALRQISIGRSMQANDAVGVLTALDRVGSTFVGGTPRSSESRALRSQLRDVRVGLQEAQLTGESLDELQGRAREIERRIATAAGEPLASNRRSIDDLITQQPQRCVSFLRHRDRLYAVTTGIDTSLVDLGPIVTVQRAARAHRTGLRRMASGDPRSRQLAETASAKLSALLVEPLQLPPSEPIAIVDVAALAGLCWSGLDALRARDFYLAPSIRAALVAADPIAVPSIGLATAGDLEFADDEIGQIATAWQHVSREIVRNATLDQTHRLLRSAVVVHLATHGTFRADNPFVSAIHLADGELRLLDLERLDRLPSVVVLASCDSGAATEVGSELVGVADALLALGVRTVIAPSLIVDDGAAARYSVDLHRLLATGMTPAAAATQARARAFDRGTPHDRSAAAAFTVHGDASNMQTLEVAPA